MVNNFEISFRSVYEDKQNRVGPLNYHFLLQNLLSQDTTKLCHKTYRLSYY